MVLVILATFLVSLISIIGILTLFLKEHLLDRILSALVAFAAGALIGVAFLDLFPEAASQAEIYGKSVSDIFLYGLFGFCSFFVLEQFLSWHHHHASRHPEIMPFSYLILVSDAFHNFLDGLVIAGSFAVSIPLGVITTLGVILHEIPQEIGDFGILVYGGFTPSRALFLNFFSAVSAILGGILGVLILGEMSQSILFLLPFAAGSFVYISSADLIPEMRTKGQGSLTYFLTFIFGISLIWFLRLVMPI